MSEKTFPTIAIIGVGLIGGSIGLAAKRYCLADKVIGIGRSERSLTLAKGIAAIDECSLEMKLGVMTADLVVVATPAESVITIVETIAPYLKRGAIVTDTAGTKRNIVSHCESFLNENNYFVGGHPLISSDRSGVSAAFPDIFRNESYILTPSNATSIHALTKITSFVEALGAKPELMSPEEHDMALITSKCLPHILSASLLHAVNDTATTTNGVSQLSCVAFKDFTKISERSDYAWRDICLRDTQSVIEAIINFENYLHDLKLLLAKQDEKALEDFFDGAGKIRKMLRNK